MELFTARAGEEGVVSKGVYVLRNRPDCAVTEQMMSSARMTAGGTVQIIQRIVQWRTGRETAQEIWRVVDAVGCASEERREARCRCAGTDQIWLGQRRRHQARVERRWTQFKRRAERQRIGQVSRWNSEGIPHLGFLPAWAIGHEGKTTSTGGIGSSCPTLGGSSATALANRISRVRFQPSQSALSG